MAIPTKSDLLREIHGEMKLRKITQQDLAEMVGLSRATVFRHLNSVESASYDALIKMHEVLHPKQPQT